MKAITEKMKRYTSLDYKLLMVSVGPRVYRQAIRVEFALRGEIYGETSL